MKMADHAEKWHAKTAEERKVAARPEVLRMAIEVCAIANIEENSTQFNEILMSLSEDVEDLLRKKEGGQ